MTKDDTDFPQLDLHRILVLGFWLCVGGCVGGLFHYFKLLNRLKKNSWEFLTRLLVSGFKIKKIANFWRSNFGILRKNFWILSKFQGIFIKFQELSIFF